MMLNLYMDVLQVEDIICILMQMVMWSLVYSSIIQTAISKIRGEVLELEIGGKKRKCIPIFHPSYLLRYHSLEEGSPRDLMLKDLKKIQDLIKV